MKNYVDMMVFRTAICCWAQTNSIYGRREIAYANSSSPLRNKAAQDMEGKMTFKNKVISVVVVVVLLVAVIIAYRKGMLNVSSGAETGINQNLSNEPLLKEPEKQTSDKMILLNKGEEGIYEDLKMDVKGNARDVSLRYKFKFIDYDISKEKPAGIDIDFYIDGEEEVDSEGRFTDDTYYITVKYEVTNLKEEGWLNFNFYPQNFRIGYYDDNGFKAEDEARGFTVDDIGDIKGEVPLDRDESAVVNCCYFLKQDVIDRGNIAVEAKVVGQNKAVKMPYFVLDFDEVVE